VTCAAHPAALRLTASAIVPLTFYPPATAGGTDKSHPPATAGGTDKHSASRDEQTPGLLNCDTQLAV
jgi:hypothetical protein